MAQWVTLSSFVDGTVVERNDIQPLLDNINVLKNSNYEHSLNLTNQAGNQSTTSLTLVAVTIDKYTLEIDTEGGDLLVQVGIDMRHSAAAGRVRLALLIDGVYHTPITSTSDEVMYQTSNPAFEIPIPSLVFLIPDVTPGVHTLSLHFSSGDAGTVTINGLARRTHMTVMELH